MHLVVSGGGTGGHIYPALAVVHALERARPDGVELAYVGGARGFERRLVAGSGLPYHELVVRSLRSGERDVHLVLDPMRLGASIPQAWWLLGRLRPRAIFTTGGYLAIPLVMAARARGIPTLVWEGNVMPGRATRAIGRFATRMAVSFPPTLAALGPNAFVSGTPIRSFAGIDRALARESFGVGPDERLLLLFSGSQAGVRLNDALTAALPEILASWRVLHVTGEEGVDAATGVRERLSDELRDRYQPEPFLTDRMADALVAADLVVGRAGSSTCAEVAAVGVASILVPYPFAGAHQRLNAGYLADAGAARLVPDAELDGARLLNEVAQLRDDTLRAAMATAARGLGRPDAAATLADALLGLAERRPVAAGTPA
jgi:UDP-N-acetylglucosamine--N-acetylmuramyl-(pentapeptide) pyrophosphoryl-undecaprenol N-acetylglucosamine transferase